MKTDLTNVRKIVCEAEKAKKENSKIIMNYSEAYMGE